MQNAKASGRRHQFKPQRRFGANNHTRQSWALVNNLIGALSECNEDIQERMIGHLTQCDEDYGRRVAEGLGRTTLKPEMETTAAD